MKIEYSLNKFWSEFTKSNVKIFFNGYLNYENELVIDAKTLYNLLFEKLNRKNKFKNLITEELFCLFDGNFSAIIQIDSNLIIFTDYIRSYPIYFFKNDFTFFIFDHIPNSLVPTLTIDEFASEVFLLQGYVLGNNTVFKEIKSLQPCEVLFFKEKEVEIKSYFKFDSGVVLANQSKNSGIVTYEKIDTLFLTCFKRMIKSCPNVRNWVVPLSGGHDSRLIINYLYRLGCKNVICFTYGNIDSKEVLLSKQAAKALNYKWYFVDYINNDWNVFHKSSIFDDFINYSFNGCNSPHVQDLYALNELKQKNIINDSDVVVPGHTAFTESESAEICNLTSIDESVDYVFNKYYTLFKSKKDFRFKEELKEMMVANNINYKEFPDFFNWSERQVKYIGNSVRAYEFFNLKWRMPFWEKCIIDFWLSLDYKDRIERKILFEASQNKLFVKELLEVPLINKFDKPVYKESFLKKILPSSLKSFLVYILDKKTSIAEATNHIFSGKGNTVERVIGGTKFLPKKINKYIKPFLIRKPYQMNINSLMSIYTLKKEVFKESYAKKNIDNK